MRARSRCDPTGDPAGGVVAGLRAGVPFGHRREPSVPWTVEGTMTARVVPVTAPVIVGRKGGDTPIVMVTAYDAPSARVVDGAGVDMILVGDSVAMVVLGYADT